MNNVTRFIIISKEDLEEIDPNSKTSIIVALNGDKPGGLYEILQEFAENHINLTKIESRPSKEGMGKYIFFIDFEGHRKEVHINETLNIINKKVKFLKILGSYKQYDC